MKIAFIAAVGLTLMVGGGWFVLRALQQSREEAVAAIARSNLRAIAQTMHIYAERSGSAPSLSALVTAGHLTPKTLQNPFDPRVAAAGESAPYSFTVRTLPASGLDPRTVIAHDWTAYVPCGPFLDRRIGRAVLFADGSAVVIEESEFQRLLAQPWNCESKPSSRPGVAGAPAP